MPADQSRAVAQVARDPGAAAIEVDVPDAGHNDAVLPHGPALVDAMVGVAALAGITGCH